MLANIVHLYTYHENVLNNVPFVPVVFLGALAIFFFFVANDGAFMLGLGFGMIAALLSVTLPWSHTELRHGVEMQIQVNHQAVWVPAARLPNGVWWPSDPATRVKHPDHS